MAVGLHHPPPNPPEDKQTTACDEGAGTTGEEVTMIRRIRAWWRKRRYLRDIGGRHLRGRG